MNDTKPWYKSTGVTGAIAVIVFIAVQFFDVQITEAELQETITQIGVAVSAVIALWGRIRADKRIDTSLE